MVLHVASLFTSYGTPGFYIPESHKRWISWQHVKPSSEMGTFDFQYQPIKCPHLASWFYVLPAFSLLWESFRCKKHRSHPDPEDPKMSVWYQRSQISHSTQFFPQLIVTSSSWSSSCSNTELLDLNDWRTYFPLSFPFWIFACRICQQMCLLCIKSIKIRNWFYGVATCPESVH